VRLRNGTMFVLEVKGQDSPQNQAKRAALPEWARRIFQTSCEPRRAETQRRRFRKARSLRFRLTAFRVRTRGMSAVSLGSHPTAPQKPLARM
jgi:hypothetical protein